MSCPRCSSRKAEVGEQLDDLAEPRLVQFRPGVVLGQDALEARVLGFEVEHRLVDQRADRRVRARGVALEEVPSSARRRPEDVVGDIEVALVGEIALLRVGKGLLAPLLEAVGYVFEKDQAKRDVLVFGGVHVAAQLVRRGPQRSLKRQSGCRGDACSPARSLLTSPRQDQLLQLRPSSNPTGIAACSRVRSISSSLARYSSVKGTVLRNGLALPRSRPLDRPQRLHDAQAVRPLPAEAVRKLREGWASSLFSRPVALQRGKKPQQPRLCAAIRNRLTSFYTACALQRHSEP